jgi:ATP-binding cassette subfamily B protein
MAEPTRTAHPLRRLWHYAEGHRSSVVWATTCSVLNKLFDLAPPFLIGMAVDVVVRRESSIIGQLAGIESLEMQLWALAGLNALIWGLESVFEYLYQVAWRRLAQSIQDEARIDAYAHVQSLELQYFESNSTGGLMSVLNDDVNQLERFLDHGANDILQVSTTVLTVGATFFAMSPAVALWAIAPVPVILWGSFAYQRRLEPRYEKVRALVGDLNVALANKLGGVATIKAFSAEAREVESLRETSAQYREANGEAIRLSSAFIPLIRMAILAGFCATMVLGGRLVFDGVLEVGSYSVLVFLTQRLLWPLTRLGETFDQYQRAMASTRRIMDLLDVEPKIVEGSQSLTEPVQGAVAFEEVDFAYPGQHPLLENFNLQIEAGETHAVVGLTGSGKSTLVKLLLRYYDPAGGCIRLDGTDLRELSFAGLRGHMGLVSQDVYLFHGSVRDNIAYGVPEASDDEIREAARLAEADEFISSFPQGYDTLVGERGQRLSGGQRQRISIARAILTDPRVLILDEATSAVDNETEAAIQRSLEHVARDRTTVIVAHRLSTIRQADCIHVLEAGKVVEAGRHEELLELDGRYAALWRVQTGGGSPRLMNPS